MNLTFPATFDNFYDNRDASLNSVACSNGPAGLVNRFPKLGNLPGFPYIGGAFAVSSWSSPNCGTCWSLTYPQTGVTINYLAIDTSGVGFNMAQGAMDKLTNGQTRSLGKINVIAKQVPAASCGI
ncbi:cerato-platanin-like protein [Dentipellis sp. KUC8613]|nr:cerato-platanin-like protein [Dentipellis sp. KUC8613]